MFNWLNDEAQRIKWNTFFIFRAPENATTRDSVFNAQEKLPEDYRNFVQQFGTARLFRDLDNGWYNLTILSKPKVWQLGGNDLLRFGFFVNGGHASFRLTENNVEHAVFEGEAVRLRKAADSFSEWLTKRFAKAKKLYTKREWADIVRGPAPFSQHELAILEAAQMYSFESLGRNENGKLLIKVHNGSKLRLHYLSVGVRIPGRGLSGATHLDVSEIKQGETKILERDCYKSLAVGYETEIFRRPSPLPEERRMYWELRDAIKNKGGQSVV